MGEVKKIFGWDSSEGIINRSIITTIQIIYKNRQTGKKYHLNELKRLLSNQMLLEEYLANTENNEIQFHNEWNEVYEDVSNARRLARTEILPKSSYKNIWNQISLKSLYL